MSALPDPRTEHLGRLARRRPLPSPGGLEQLDDAAEPLSADEVAGQVEQVLGAALERLPGDEVGDPREFRRALGILLGETQRAARKLDRDPSVPLTRGEANALEAVIRTDGSRPSLLVRGDAVDAQHPLAAAWAEPLAKTQDSLRDRLRAVGRVEPADGTSRNFFGTAWLVDADKGLALTNLHVLEAVWRRFAHQMQRDGDRFRVLDGVFVDFAAEAGSLRTNRFRVVEAVPSRVDGPGFARLDAAVLRLEPTAESEGLPLAIPAAPDPDGPRGLLASFVVVGFPGPSRYTGGVHEGVDWTWVNATLFGQRYGVKRLAPGTAHKPLGTLSGDVRRWVFGHDLTTLGGSSGSPVLSWLDPEPLGFGLHFAGASVDTNMAHAVAACADELREMGVPIPV